MREEGSNLIKDLDPFFHLFTRLKICKKRQNWKPISEPQKKIVTLLSDRKEGFANVHISLKTFDVPFLNLKSFSGAIISNDSHHFGLKRILHIKLLHLGEKTYFVKDNRLSLF